MNANVRMMDLNAAADFLGPGAIEVPVFEREILDAVRRASLVLPRFKSKPATGHPHRYFEQTAIATAAAVDPRNLSATPTSPTRVERPAFIKAVTAQTNISMFDKDVTEQQGQFAGIVAQDIDDITNGVEVKRASMLWTGSDTSLTTPTTLEWMGALAQITGSGGTYASGTIALGASIIDGIKTQIADLVSQVGYVVRPSGIAMNPLLLDAIEKEAKASHIELGTVAITAGVTVKALSTQAGVIPLIPDPYMPTDSTGKYGFSTPSTGNNYYAVIMDEAMVEIPVISGKEYNPNPRLFQLGLTGNLAGQFVAVKFDALIFRGAAYAHSVLAVNRP